LTKLNYQELVQLDEKHRERGLRILGFPCNQFGGQEPGTNEDIKKFVAGFGVKFQMFDKIDVNGSNAHPIYVFLKSKLPGFITNDIKWNFSKFVLDRNGTPIQRFSPQDAPSTMVPLLESLLENVVE